MLEFFCFFLLLILIKLINLYNSVTIFPKLLNAIFNLYSKLFGKQFLLWTIFILYLLQLVFIFYNLLRFLIN